MAQKDQQDFDSLSVKYGINRSYDWVGDITDWSVLNGALSELKVSKLDIADINGIWSRHPKNLINGILVYLFVFPLCFVLCKPSLFLFPISRWKIKRSNLSVVVAGQIRV